MVSGGQGGRGWTAKVVTGRSSLLMHYGLPRSDFISGVRVAVPGVPTVTADVVRLGFYIFYSHGGC